MNVKVPDNNTKVLVVCTGIGVGQAIKGILNGQSGVILICKESMKTTHELQASQASSPININWLNSINSKKSLANREHGWYRQFDTKRKY